jgi:hypothetical protein
MPEGRRYSPENPGESATSLAAFITEKGYEITGGQVQSVWFFHPEWQRGHAAEAEQRRELNRQKKEAEKEQKRLEKEAKRAEKEAEKEQKRQEKEAAKAEREAKAAQEGGADGDDSDSEPVTTRKRLKTKAPEDQVSASAASF